MMKIWNLILLLPTTYTPVLSAETYSYPIETIESVEISAGVEFNIQCGDVAKIEISAASEDNFKLSIKDKKLEIEGKRKSNWFFLSRGNNHVKADITLKKSPKIIEVSAGSEGEMDSCFRKEENLSLSASAGSSFRIDTIQSSINQLEVYISSGSTIRIRGTLNIAGLELEASSGSAFKADKKVFIEVAEVSVSSGASVEICGTATLTGRASSGGNISVSETTLTDKKTGSGGRIKTNCQP